MKTVGPGRNSKSPPVFGKSLILILSSVFVLVAGCLYPASGLCGKEVIRISDKKLVTFHEMVEDLKGVKLIFIGEAHNMISHHRAQLRVIRALREEGVSVAIALEMFRQDSQKALDQWISGKLSEEEFIGIYENNWSRWEWYRPIFLYARDEKIPLVGINIPRSIIRQVASNGFSSLTEEQMAKLPAVTCVVHPAYRDFIRRTSGRHGKDEKSFTRFCEAQLLWDKAMAKHLVDFLGKNPAYTVVVLAGGSHSWKYGIPAQVSKIASHGFRVLLPEVFSRIGTAFISSSDADYLLMDTQHP